jgi:hypothetical protein
MTPDPSFGLLGQFGDLGQLGLDEGGSPPDD